jgi:hypothetical protein
MRKSRIILAMITLLAFAGGGLAFKATRFTNKQAFTSTTMVTIKIGDVVYFTTGNLCTTINKWIHTTGPFSTVWHLLPGPAYTLTLQEIAGPLTTTVEFFPCVTTFTRTTTIM